MGRDGTENKRHTKGGKVYQAQKAIMKPIHEKKKTRPWRSKGLKTGMRWAFLVRGLRGGGRKENWKPRTMMPSRWVMRCSRRYTVGGDDKAGLEDADAVGIGYGM